MKNESSAGPAGFLETLYGGIDMTHINDGGVECAKMGNSVGSRAIETSIISLIALYELRKGINQFKQLEYTKADLNIKRILSSQRRTYLLVILTLVFGVEIGFKLQQKQLIFLLNPCHIFTMLQIYFLASRPTTKMLFLFHSHQPILFGTLLAMIFPETETRYHPLQKEIYWIQHLLIYTIPAQLMPLGGPYKLKNNERQECKSWWYNVSIGAGCLYHWCFLQGISLLTTCNLNFMLCANPDDPFRGPFYRVIAFFYFHILFWLHSKMYKYVSKVIMGLFGPEEIKED